MVRIKYECEVITPMVLRGADQNAEKLDLRVPSVKGTMRFWWRVLKEKQDIAKVRELEGYIFGCAGDKNGTLRSNFKIRSGFIGNVTEFPEKNLLPYVVKDRHTAKFHSIKEGTKFYIEFFINTRLYLPEKMKNDKSKVKIDVSNEVQMAFEALSVLGGLGARSRRGFGSFMIIRKEIDGKENNQIKDYEYFEAQICKLSKLKRLHIEETKEFVKKENNINTLLDCIDKTTHEERKNLTKEYDIKDINNALGFVLGNSRLASPLYFSIIPNGKSTWNIIVTILGTTYNKDDEYGKKICEIQNKFIDSIR